jgi:tetratricopeptide (TPR) repeat protein
LVSFCLSSRCFIPAFALAVISSLAGAAQGATAESTKSQVGALLTEAAQAEAKGDAAKARELLQDAVRTDPENEVAHWQLGQIKVDKQWTTVEQAQRRAAADPLQAEYRDRRGQATANVQGQLALARWCRKKELNDEALVHWARALAADPKNDEALRPLDLRWQNGRLLTSEQAARYKDQLREAKKNAERWAPKIAKWRREVAGRDEAMRAGALAEIRGTTEVDSIFPLEQVTLGRDARDKRYAEECLQIGLAYVEALGKMPVQVATESLARHAVLAADDSVRAMAVQRLKLRDKHDYVPMLLGALSMPIESTFSVQNDGAGNVHYTHSLYREGADKDWSTDANYFTMQHLLGGHDYVYRLALQMWEDRTYSGPSVAQMARVSRTRESSYGRVANSVESRVASTNEAAEALNARIIPVLHAATGENYDTPREWWDYWHDDNEYYSYDHPVDYRYFSGTDDRTYGHPFDTFSVTASCFVKGTPVWTKTGKRVIESLELGDLVLAQDIETGQLEYKPIIGRTVRPPSPIVKLSIDNDEIRTTRGHLFWVPGMGWRMAKELEKGMRLHGLKGSLDISTAQSDGESEAYNLVVAGDSSYFVGD